MSLNLETLAQQIGAILGERVVELKHALGELTLTVRAADYLDVATTLRDHPELKFEQLIDLCGVDYSSYRDGTHEGPRYAAVSHLLSITKNWRLRLKVFAADDDFPCVASVTPVWNSANWFEREAFDMYGVIFDGHDDLRRILTDYGFIGHPMRKDFPVSGHVEMRYDAEQKRVVYQPVTIEPREITPRIIREDKYGGL
ncbi:NADH-quinone oxidoreductase subunit C [Pelomonas aquatica]|jgi:NADH-quinone oxidoreductase subunit C|uniref:NADH-quinone oxidoreductase subunit C n=1 Tax=Pelomonas aquatica TaxID=431058 RepID=A0A9X4LED7_9BURK|nr:NADH-quinone oxidoreductase subunit C [Pelomonas aquatica]MCY4754950.1 NADH-quinone oxidoreductase subunit C [Pelomonas aquatica]MDG0861032.1 NADH-quinone oxidoreductase subunit C [Pelomonas aquatica]